MKCHMMERNYPVARKDLAAILNPHGRQGKILADDDSGQTIRPFRTMPMAGKDEAVYLEALWAAGRFSTRAIPYRPPRS